MGVFTTPGLQAITESAFARALALFATHTAHLTDEVLSLSLSFIFHKCAHVLCLTRAVMIHRRLGCTVRR